MNEVFIYLLSYIMVFLMSFGGLQFLTGGFLLPFLKVKSSRGKKVLVWVHGIADSYFRVGFFDDEFLVFTNRAKDFTKTRPTIRVKVPRGCVGRTLNVNFVQYDENTCGVINPLESFEGVTTNEPKAYDALITRAIEAGVTDMKENIVIVLLVLVILALGFIGFMVFKNQQFIVNLASISGNIV